MPVFVTNQLIKTDIGSCWEFFSNPDNLSLITPPDMRFRIRFPVPVPSMYAGMVIRYTVSPLMRIPLEWITEITHVRKFEYFVDNQIKGPFRIWHHQHIFRQVPGGIEMIDIVNYQVPFGIIGGLLANWLVRSRIEQIFRHRKAVIEGRFGN